MSAAKDGDLETLRDIASQGFGILFVFYVLTPKQSVCGNLAFVTSMVELLCACKLLLEMKADPLARLFRGGGKGRTPMRFKHYAARNGHLEVCRYFIQECGVDPDIPTHDGTTPIHVAASSHRSDN
eukprot:764299-Hanusia_phi.AAC.3